MRSVLKMWEPLLEKAARHGWRRLVCSGGVNLYLGRRDRLFAFRLESDGYLTILRPAQLDVMATSKEIIEEISRI